MLLLLLVSLISNQIIGISSLSTLDMLTPAITTIKEPESLEQGSTLSYSSHCTSIPSYLFIELRYKLEIANQELATLRALIIEKDHLIALLTLGSKDNHFNNSYTSSDTDDCNQTNEVDESKSSEYLLLPSTPLPPLLSLPLSSLFSSLRFSSLRFLKFPT